MAINPNLISDTSPYIHSRVYNFVHFVAEINSDEQYNNELRALKDSLTTWIGQLKSFEQEIYNACGVSDYNGLNQKLFVDTQDAYRKVTQAVLTNPNFIRSLLPQINREIAEKISNSLPNSQEFFDTLFDGIELYDVSTFSNLLIEYMRSQFEPNAKVISIETFQQKFGTEFSKYIGNQTKMSIKQGTKRGALGRVVRGIIQNQGFKGTYISSSSFISNFKKFFDIEAANLHVVFTNNEIKNHNRNVELAARAAYDAVKSDKGLPAYISNLVGQLGEQNLSLAFDQSELAVVVKVHQIGDISEDELYEKFSKIDPHLTKLSIHDTSKMSQSDELLEIVLPGRGTTLIRVQSKASLLDQLTKIGESYKENVRPQMVRFFNGQDSSGTDINITTLFESLMSKGILSEYDSKNLTYLLANMVWFNQVGSYEGDKKSGSKRTRRVGSTGGIGFSQAVVDRTLSQAVAQYIGLTTSDSLGQEVKQLQLGGSNIFYFLSGKVLFPISMVLEELLHQLNNEEQKLFNLHTQVQMRGTISTTAASLYTKKRDSVNGLKGGYLYQDEALVRVGQVQGQEIVEKLGIKVNANFSIAAIINSAYNFANK